MKNLNYLILLFFLSTPILSQEIYFPPIDGDEWETIDPVELNWCSDIIDSLYNFLDSTDTKAFLLLKDGKIVLEKYFDDFTQDDEWYWASAAKPMMGTLMGIAQQDGYLDLDDPTKNYLGDGWTTAPSEKEALITLRHHLSMTTGLDDALNNLCTMPACLQYIADAGERWSYHNATYYLLADVIEAATGKDLNQYFDDEITATTGIDGQWQNSGYAKILRTTPRDFARYGLLFLNNGYWGTTPVLEDADFFQAMITPSQELNYAYGYYWWLNGQETYMLPYTQDIFSGSLGPDAPPDLYVGVGANGQYLNIAPSEGIVFVRMGEYLSGQLVPFVYNNDIWRFINDFECLPSSAYENKNQPFSIYPNPADDFIQLNLPENINDFTVNIYDAFSTKKIKAENSLKVEIKHLPAGIYHIIINSKNGIIKNSFVKL